MRISIITPSFRNSEWLKLCIASVADQGVAAEHIIQDADSDDGTLAWLPGDSRVKAFVEKDQGMYDAVNRGLRRATGDILAYLNCDEQYLPGALESVRHFFEAHPEVEVLFADAVVVDSQGNYLCHRRAVLPGKYHSWISGTLAILTCATFFRRRLFDGRGLFFKPEFKVAGDAEWILRLIDSKANMACLPQFTSVYTETGANMNLRPDAEGEKRAFHSAAPGWIRLLKPVIVGHYRLRKLMAGGYTQKPFNYSIYTEKSPGQRVSFTVEHPTGQYRRPLG